MNAYYKERYRIFLSPLTLPRAEIGDVISNVFGELTTFLLYRKKYEKKSL